MTETLWEAIQLPSLGRYYRNCPDGMVEISSWTTAQEEMIIRHSRDPSGNIVDKLIESNVIFPTGFKPEDLLVTDQHYLLMKLRAISIGCVYTVDYICTNCKTKQEVSTNIEDLEVKVPEDSTEWDEPFEVTLPRCGRTVAFRHLRVKDEQAISKNQTAKEAIGINDSVSFTMAKKIISIDGDSSLKFDEKKDFVRGLVMIDSSVLQNEEDRYSTGIDTEINVTCRKCRLSDKWDIPLQIGFFRPKRADIDAAVESARQSGARD